MMDSGNIGVVLDVDGVLVDVEDSYRRAIVDTVEILYGYTPDTGYIQELKDAGGFNNDWDVTYALSLYYLADDVSDTVSFDSVITAVKKGEGGLSSVREHIETVISEEQLKKIHSQWDPSKIREIFQQLYLGHELYQEIEGKLAQIQTEGLINEETILIEPETINQLEHYGPLGVLTGRPKREAEIALRRAGISVKPEHTFTMDDWPEQKPDPSALLELAMKFSTAEVVYAGDTLDDIRTAVNANTETDDIRFHGLGVLSGGLNGTSGMEKFVTEGASDVLETINELPDWMSENLGV